MTQNLVSEKEGQLQEKGYIHFSGEELDNLDKDKAERIEQHFRGHTMMMLPDSEIAFFEWLKKEDQGVWDDLWLEEENPYNVSIDFLHHFLSDGNGFPICDLVKEKNYWFSARHIKPKGMEKFEDINQKINKNERFTFDEALLFEIMQNSIDIWHFCYRYKTPVNIAKQKIKKMQSDDLLVHLTMREDLVKYLDV
jgi:hypothetical protein